MTDEQFDALMEMLGGIFVQVSRIYDAVMTMVPDSELMYVEHAHENGRLMGSPPQLIEKAWLDEAVEKTDSD